MGDTYTTIRIDSASGNTPVYLNGREIADIPPATNFAASEAVLGVLANSNVKFTIVDGAASAAPNATGEAAGGFAASPEPITDPAREPRELAQGENAHLGQADEQKADEAASNDGEEPAEDADDDDGEVDGKRFSAADTLAGSIAKITENLDEFTPRQIASLIAAEEKAETPRSTLIAALQKKHDA